MSDDPFGVCCSIALVACLDVYAGVCFDFASVRHGFTETMFKCTSCRRAEKDRTLEDDERAPLIQETQPTTSRAMLANGQ